jgi:hypothetical protein
VTFHGCLDGTLLAFEDHLGGPCTLLLLS